MHDWPGFPIRNAPLWQNCITAALMGVVAAFGVVVILLWIAG